MSHDSSEFPPGPPPPDHPGPADTPQRAPSWSQGDGSSRPEPTGRRSGPHRTLRLLRRAYRWQRRVPSLTALGYFAGFLVLTVKAPGLMTRPGPGGLPTGLVLALAQIPVTWLAVLLYEASARSVVDPLIHRVRQSHPAHQEGGR
ncbi:DUF485 domain-containing protein [Streptomyces sp. SID4985]|uniref:DUF485 domain-containing protein n=1 Tax=unclassified Streptomyces TaxID=2593676 RepID=UPI001369B47E|nr:DUF485 domain-containing protein [Streptomyces sp. SID4985]MYQ45909.1 DUF485 domain-containing protein [Streptomyces sp. SID4985]